MVSLSKWVWRLKKYWGEMASERFFEFTRRWGVWIFFALTVAADLALRHTFFATAPLNRTGAYPASILFEVLLFWLVLRFVSAFGPRAARALFFGVAAAYGFAVIGSWGFYLYFNNFPGVFAFSYLLEETGDFLGMLADESSTGVALLVAGWATLSVVLAWTRFQARPRPLGWPRRLALAVILLALALILNKTVGVTSGFAMPFTDALFSFKDAVFHHIKGERNYLRLQGRIVIDKPKAVDRPAPKNVLIILNESVRRKNLSPFGYGRATMPLLEKRLKGWGERVYDFPNAYSNATTTTTSTATLVTGRYSVEPLSLIERSGAIYEEFKRFSDVRTAYVTSHNFHTGNFKEFIGSPALDLYTYREKENWPPFCSAGADDHLVAGKFGEFLAGLGREQKFFALLQMSNTHYPYTVPEKWQAFGDKALTDRYDNSLHYLDTTLELVFKALEEAGRADETIVVVTSDHGESLGDEPGPKGHLGRSTRSTSVVPFFWVMPVGFLPQGSEAERIFRENAATNVQNADIFPTLVDLLGLGGVERFPGTSLARPVAPNRPIFIYNGPQKGLEANCMALVRGGDFVVLGVEGNGTFFSLTQDMHGKDGPLEGKLASQVVDLLRPYPILADYRTRLERQKF